MTALCVFVAVMLTPSVSDPRCEYIPRPLCVDTPAPRLTWVTEFSGKNWKQTAYRILVASDEAKLAKNEGDLWDSGKVDSAESIQIPYAGKPLASRQACYWKVRVWGGQGEPSNWSRPQEWEMGLLDDSAWHGSAWIGDDREGPAPYLRKEFAAEGKVSRARIYVCGLGYADVHLNGKRVAPEVERDTAYTNFDKRVLYTAYDVTAQIHKGENCIGAVLGSGWYDVHDLATWNFDRAPWRGRPRLRLLLAIDYADGRSQTVVSDPTWKTSTGPILSDGIYTGEEYDSRLEMPGWDSARFDDRNWQSATKMPAPKGELAARLCPPVEITQTFKPKAVAEPKPGVYVVDFGQNFSGHARIHVDGPAGTRIAMRYSERLDKHGMIERSQIEQFMTKENPPQPFQTDVFVCDGKGPQTWEQRFSYSGFRYMEVTGFPGKPTAANFEGRFAHTDFESAGSFECSNALLDKIQRATRYSYLSNAQSIPTDCPQREKNGWTGDAQLAAEAGLMNFRSASFYTKWLNDFADDQEATGQVSVIVPTGGWGAGACNPAWDSAYPIVAADLYRYCGDTQVLADHYDDLKRYVDYLSSRTEDGVVPFDSLGDWVPWKTETSSKLTSTVYVAVDAGIVSRAAKLLGRAEDAEKYAKLAETTKEAFNRHFFKPDEETYENGSQTALAMALYFDLVPSEHRQAVFETLVKNVESLGHIDTGILGAKYLLRVLSEQGRTDLAYRLVDRKEQPGWGWWIEQGATTLWEDWKGESSLNHIMFGDVSNWFMQWIAGIGLDPEVPAFRHILIRPQPVGDLTWAKGAHESPYGPISSSWHREGNRFHLEVQIPPNTTATVRVPGDDSQRDSEGVKFRGREGGVTLYEIGSGRHAFDSVLAG